MWGSPPGGPHIHATSTVMIRPRPGPVAPGTSIRLWAESATMTSLTRISRRLGAGVTLAAITLLAPTSAVMATTGTTDDAQIIEGSLTWGFKESFRSYISGNIASGTWEVSEGASYETPNFSWEATGGGFDPETSTGTIAFGGTIQFTGHNGLLDTTVSDPTIAFDGSDQALLLLDVSGLTMDDALAGNTDNIHEASDVEFVTLDLAGGEFSVDASTQTVTGVNISTAITSAGFEAFPNYETGTAFDPISFTFTYAETSEPVVEETTEPEPEPTETESTETTEAPTTEAPADEQIEGDHSGLPWPVIIGAIVVLGAVTLGAVVLLRRRGATQDGQPDAESDQSQPSDQPPSDESGGAS